MSYLYQIPIWDWPPLNGSVSTFTLNTGTDYATSAKIAGMMWLPGGLVISKLGVYCAAVSAPPVLQVRIETHTGTAGTPTGTLVNVNAFGTFTPAAGTYHRVALNQPWTVPAGGQSVAFVVGWASGTFGSVTLNQRDTNGSQFSAWPASFNGTTWTVNTSGVGCIWPINDIDQEMHDVFPLPQLLTSNNNVQYNTGSSPNEHGSRIIAPFAFLATGFTARTRVFANGGVIGRFWLNGVQISSDVACTVTSSQLASATTVDFIQFPLPDTKIKRGDEVIISLMPTTANNIIFSNANFLNQAAADDWRAGRIWERWTRNGGAWSSANAPTNLPLGFPTTDPRRVHRRVGHPGMSGGLVG